VQFAHSKPQDSQVYREIFNAPLQFDADFSAIIFSSHWLDSALPEAHPALHELLSARLLQWQQLLDPGLADKVRRSLQVMVISGTASAQGVATQLGCSERTLRRQLQAEGCSFQGLLNESLRSLAQQLIEETGLSMSAIASALHYRDLATFSSAFRRWTGTSPTRWRARHLQGSQRRVTYCSP
jgi:AraC-like DNA-binding protein